MTKIKQLFKIETSKKTIFFSSSIILSIILCPYLLYIYQYFPSTKIWHSPFGTIEINFYQSVQHFAYFLFGKAVPLLLMFIWFITNKNWWYHVIIIPISVYMFQLISVINDSISVVDEMEFIYTVPITTIIITILYFIRGQLVVYLEAMDLKKEMEKNFK